MMNSSVPSREKVDNCMKQWFETQFESRMSGNLHWFKWKPSVFHTRSGQKYIWVEVDSSLVIEWIIHLLKHTPYFSKDFLKFLKDQPWKNIYDKISHLLINAQIRDCIVWEEGQHKLQYHVTVIPPPIFNSLIELEYSEKEILNFLPSQLSFAVLWMWYIKWTMAIESWNNNQKYLWWSLYIPVRMNGFPTDKHSGTSISLDAYWDIYQWLHITIWFKSCNGSEISGDVFFDASWQILRKGDPNIFTTPEGCNIVLHPNSDIVYGHIINDHHGPNEHGINQLGFIDNNTPQRIQYDINTHAPTLVRSIWLIKQHRNTLLRILTHNTVGYVGLVRLSEIQQIFSVNIKKILAQLSDTLTERRNLIHGNTRTIQEKAYNYNQTVWGWWWEDSWPFFFFERSGYLSLMFDVPPDQQEKIPLSCDVVVPWHIAQDKFFFFTMFPGESGKSTIRFPHDKKLCDNSEINDAIKFWVPWDVSSTPVFLVIKDTQKWCEECVCVRNK